MQPKKKRTKKDKKDKTSKGAHKMNNFDQVDFADEMIEAIEKEYGQPIERIAKFNEYDGFFKISIIFVDYRLLEAKVKVLSYLDMPSIQIQGYYY
jgi:hypothetical protein